MVAIAEDGSGVPGANTLVSPGHAAFLLFEAGSLAVEAEIVLPIGSTLEDDVLTATGALTDVPAGRLVILPAGLAQARGAWVTSAGADSIGLAWAEELAPATLAAAASLLVVEADVWWAPNRFKLESTLIAATRFLSESWAFGGELVAAGQALKWPRTGLYPEADHPPDVVAGVEVSSTIVPLVVRQAVAHLAVEELARSLFEVEDPGAWLDAKSIAGVVSKTYANPGGRRRFPMVDRLLDGLGYRVDGAAGFDLAGLA